MDCNDAVVCKSVLSLFVPMYTEKSNGIIELSFPKNDTVVKMRLERIDVITDIVDLDYTIFELEQLLQHMKVFLPYEKNLDSKFISKIRFITNELYSHGSLIVLWDNDFFSTQVRLENGKYLLDEISFLIKIFQQAAKHCKKRSGLAY